jgi:tetratricopeptide (TPR) repeat protein
LLHAVGRDAEGLAAIHRYVEKHPGESEMRFAAMVLDRIDQVGPSEEMYRRWAALAKKPEVTISLAEFLGRRGKREEALSLCRQLFEAGFSPPEVVAVGLASLRQDEGGRHSYQIVENMLQAALKKDPNQVALLMELAELRELQENYKESIAIYRRVLLSEPSNVIALNNLAYYLILCENSPQEALVCIERAIGLAGRQPGLLDTQALAKMKVGRASEAISDLEHAIQEEPRPARKFHLAKALSMVDQRAEAVKALKEANLKMEDLHPLERDDYQLFVASLKQ